jgi:hypothetical protein
LIIGVTAPLALLLGQRLLLVAAGSDWLGTDVDAAVLNQSRLDLNFLGDRVGLLLGFAFLLVVPMGLGIGIAADNRIAIDVVSYVPGGRGYDPFVSSYMLGGDFSRVPRLHSGFGDLIVWVGVLGLIAAIALVLLLIAVLDSVVVRTLRANARAFAVTAVLLAGWQLFGGSVFTPALAVVLWVWCSPHFRRTEGEDAVTALAIGKKSVRA